MVVGTGSGPFPTYPKKWDIVVDMMALSLQRAFTKTLHIYESTYLRLAINEMDFWADEKSLGNKNSLVQYT